MIPGTMKIRDYACSRNGPAFNVGGINYQSKGSALTKREDRAELVDYAASMDVDVDIGEIYFLITHFLSAGPFQKTFRQLWEELSEHELLPRRYHAWYSRSGAVCKDANDAGNSFPLNYENLIGRYPHVEKDHLVRLLKQLMLMTSPPLRCISGKKLPSAVDVPTLLGTGNFSLLSCERNKMNKYAKKIPIHLRWPHMQADQVRGLSLREIGGGFAKHHRAPSIRVASYAIAKPSSMVPKMQNVKKLRGHRDAVYCAIFDRLGRYVITGSDDRLVKIWSMETALCLASCRGHEGDITDLSVSSNNAIVASASNDFTIRVWRLPDGLPISVLRGHTGAVTAIAFSPRPIAMYHLLSSSDDGTCRVWDARSSQCRPRVYLPKPKDANTGLRIGVPSSSAPLSAASPGHQILCCAYNANGTVFVTGSSDTFARVWSANKPNSDDPDQVCHEMDILAGHENDVNYVQFSGCAVSSRSSPSDSLVEDSIPKFKNSWFNHDNIVTCSRDGSAIIWVPRSRRSHGKVGRWVKAYHLKVPPPPMPPRPPHGGPRQRCLPTPRGVNMIVWSLDNRFVLAAIMDNRICVWNANDGSLVHSLAGHTASTYVLDVHPFNPRIAMSAGYDGKTILWDIWEGTPIRVYEIAGRFQLVDGKFSQDGTSIVLSDDVGQIYLLNTGEGESQKDAKYDQFFLGDYRPLTQDTHGNVVDQETQLSPYVRNIQDPLCDSSMLPYPEPYQSTYQQRRFCALGIEWRPSSIKFAVGTDIGIGQEFPVLPLPDLDMVIEPLPEYVDAMYWEPENDGINDDNDSEYDAAEENFSDGKTCPSDGPSSDSDCSEEDKVARNQKDSMHRSKRKKTSLQVGSVTSSGRRVKKRISDEQEGTSSRSKKHKKLKTSHKTSRKKSTKSKTSRPQRVAARNAINNFSQITDTSEEEDENEEDSASDTSESSLEGGSYIQRKEDENKWVNDEKTLMDSAVVSSNAADDVVRHLKHPDSLNNAAGNKPKLLVRLPLHNRKVPVSSGNHVDNLNTQTAASSNVQNAEKDGANKEISDNYTRQQEEEVKTATEDGSELRAGCSNINVSWGKLKIRTSNGTQGEDAHQLDSDSGVINKQGFEVGDKDISSSLVSDAKGSPEPKKSTKIKITLRPRSRELPPSRFPEELNRTPQFRVNSEVNDSDPNVSLPGMRTRTIRFKDPSQEASLVNETGAGTSVGGAEKLSKKAVDHLSRDGGTSRSSKNKRESGYSGERSCSVERKINWLLLTEQEEGYRYIPQLGDEVVYMRQGHEDYIAMTQPSPLNPWLRYGDKVRAVEVCVIEELKYGFQPGSGESCCLISLKLTDPRCSVVGHKFHVTLAELDNFPDFIVERSRYELAVLRNWLPGDKCQVWWRNEGGVGGSWWEGRITAVKDKCNKYPGSPWERYHVKYEDDTADFHYHCLWELHDPQRIWEQPIIDMERKQSILTSLYRLLRVTGTHKDRYGIAKLNEVADKSDFINTFPVPLSLDIIKSRIENDYYRNLDAMRHDFGVMAANAESYFQNSIDLLRKVSRISRWFDKILSDLP